ncbi:hypothetical protein, partial [Micromonospora fiedleri]|uniref:hypothetical protein n=1 Tax=Micromonospora fiedleri TaxID=1157498 RepID=UPI001EE37564
ETAGSEAAELRHYGETATATKLSNRNSPQSLEDQRKAVEAKVAPQPQPQPAATSPDRNQPHASRKNSSQRSPQSRVLLRDQLL